MIYEIILSFSFKFVIVYSVYFHERILFDSLRVRWSSCTRPPPPSHSIPLILQIYQNEWEIDLVCSALLYDTSSVTAAATTAATVSTSWSVLFCLHFLPSLPSATGSRNKIVLDIKQRKLNLMLYTFISFTISCLNQWALGFVDEYRVLSSIIDLDALRHLIVVDDVQFVPIDWREENVGLVDSVDLCHVESIKMRRAHSLGVNVSASVDPDAVDLIPKGPVLEVMDDLLEIRTDPM